MANNTVAEIAVSRGKITGAIFWAPAGTALPTDATTALAGAFQNLGHIGEGGIEPSREISTDPVPDMNGDELMEIQTGFSKSYTATMLQTRNQYLKAAVFGTANVTVTAPDATNGRRIVTRDKGTLSPPGVLVLEVGDGGLGTTRTVCPIAKVRGTEGAWVGNNVRSYELTFTLSKDSNGDYTIEYDNDGIVAA